MRLRRVEQLLHATTSMSSETVFLTRLIEVMVVADICLQLLSVDHFKIWKCQILACILKSLHV